MSPPATGSAGGVPAGPAVPYVAETDGAELSVGDGKPAVDIVDTPDTRAREAIDGRLSVTNVGPTAASQRLTVELGDGTGSTSAVETELELSGSESIEGTPSVPVGSRAR